MSDQVLIVLLNAPAYAIIGYLFYKFLRFQGEESTRRNEDEKRRDNQDQKALDAIIAGHQRIDDIVKDRREVEEKRNAQSDAIVQALNNSTQMVAALEARSAYLLQSDREVSELQVAVRAEVKLMFDRFLIIFPTAKPIDTQFDDLKNTMITEIEKACAAKKGDTGPLPPITLPQAIDITLHSDPAPADAAPGGESGVAA